MDHPAATSKDEPRRLIDQQPEDSSYEEILRELAFAWIIERGLEDSRAGRTISHEERKSPVVCCSEFRSSCSEATQETAMGAERGVT